MPSGSRLARVRERKERRQAFWYLILAAGVIFALVSWGIPAFAKFAGLFVPKDEAGIVDNDNTLKPAPPIISFLPEATPSAKINVEGFADPGVELALYLNNSAYESMVVDNSGSFEFSGVELQESENIIYAVAKRGEVESERSKVFTVTRDTDSPSITIERPSDGEEFAGPEERVVNVVGVVDEDVVSLRVGERIAIVTPDGRFSVGMQLAEGEQTIVLRAEDRAGNVSEKSISLVWKP